jgi:hypothetical protein
MPYTDSYDGYPVGREARYLADMDGAFEIVNCGGGRAGQCVRQMAPAQPVVWRSGNRDPGALLGDLGWKDYTLKVDVLLEHSGYAELQGRVGKQGGNPAQLNAYFLRVTDKGAWSIIKSTQSSPTTLASGTGKALGTNAWHTLALTFAGSTITASLDGTRLGSATDGTYTAGQVGIATSQTINAQFDNLSVTNGPTPAVPDGTYTLVNKNSGLALAVSGGSTADRAPVVQAANNGSAATKWTVKAVGGGWYTLTNVAGGRLLDAPDTTAGTQLDQHTGTTAAQQWRLVPSGDTYTVTNRASGLVVDVKSHSTAAGAPVVEWPANNGTNQQWLLVRLA